MAVFHDVSSEMSLSFLQYSNDTEVSPIQFEGTTQESEYSCVYCLVFANFCIVELIFLISKNIKDTNPLSYAIHVQESLRVIIEAGYQSVSQSLVLEASPLLFASSYSLSP